MEEWHVIGLNEVFRGDEIFPQVPGHEPEKRSNRLDLLFFAFEPNHQTVLRKSVVIDLVG